MIFDLSPQPPYDFARTAACSRVYDTTQVYRSGTLFRMLRINEGLALVRVNDLSGSPTSLRIRAEVVATRGEVNEAQLEHNIRHWLAVNLSFVDFYAQAEQDPTLREIVHGLHGLHMLRTPSVFEALMVTMIEQQIALSAAQKAERWLIETYGECLTYEGIDHYVFPTPETLAMLDEAALTPLKITFVRMRRMIAIARAIVERTLDLEALRHASRDEAYQALMALNGVGHWTAAWTIIRSLGAYMYVSSADVALRRAVNQFWRKEPGRASREDTDAHFAQYGAFAGEACAYALMALELHRQPLP